MISFEFEHAPHQLTNDVLHTIYNLVHENGWELDYDVVEHLHGHPEMPVEVIICLWVHPQDEGENPTRIHIAVDGEIILHETVDWDWKGTS